MSDDGDLAKRLHADSDAMLRAAQAEAEGDNVAAHALYLRYLAYLARCTEYNAEMARSLAIPEAKIQNAQVIGMAEGRSLGREYRERPAKRNKPKGPNHG